MVRINCNGHLSFMIKTEKKNLSIFDISNFYIVKAEKPSALFDHVYIHTTYNKQD